MSKRTKRKIEATEEWFSKHLDNMEHLSLLLANAYGFLTKLGLFEELLIDEDTPKNQVAFMKNYEYTRREMRKKGML